MICVFLYVSLEYFNSDLIANANKSAVYIGFLFFSIYRLINLSACCLTTALSFVTLTQSNIIQLAGKQINYRICWNIYNDY